MKLVSMKMDGGYEGGATVAPDKMPAYPWGLTITLDTAVLEKLGLTEGLPEVGGSLKLEAKVDVVSCSENESMGGGKSCSCTLQITDLALGKGKVDAEDELYSKGKKKA